MDSDAERKKLQDWIDGYLAHPITVQLLQDSLDEQEKLVALLCNRTIVDAETFFAHFEAIGHLRGLRRTKSVLLDKLDEVKEQLKETQDAN